jgi:predicted GNAT superfamily acetyltransferase
MIAVRPLQTIDELMTLERVLASIRETEPVARIPIELVQAMRYAGNYVVGAVAAGDQMVGGSIGFIGERDGRWHLRAHITAVLPDDETRRSGIDAIRAHQRAWCLAAGLDEIVDSE